MTDPAWALADVSVDPEGLFGQAAERISRLVGDLCVIALVRDRPGVFEPVAVRHRSEGTRRLVEEALSAADLDSPAAWPACRRAARSGEPVLIDDVLSGTGAESVDPALRPYLSEHSVSSLLFVPVRARGRTIGLAGLAREGPGRSFTSDDLNVVESVVDQVALSLDNARLVGLLRRQGELDAALLAAQSDLGEGVVVLDTTTGRLAHANETFAEMTGHSVSELEAMPSFTQLLRPEDRPAGEQVLRERGGSGHRDRPARHGHRAPGRLADRGRAGDRAPRWRWRRARGRPRARGHRAQPHAA